MGFSLHPKKIDVFIVRSFIGPFLATFMLSSIIFLLQFLWKYLDELIGKGLEWYTVAELLFYAYVKEVLPLALPMAILLATIMTYGNLGEKLELVAMKAAGISLRRMLVPIGIICLFLSGFNFFVLTELSPVLTLKWAALYFDIHHKKPAFDIEPGVFYKNIDGYAIKISNKDEDGTIYNVWVYDQTKGNGNNSVIAAEKGKIEKSNDGRFLYFTLYNGNHYEELNENPGYKKSFMHNRMAFEKYKIVFDLTQFNMNRTMEDVFSSGERFKKMDQLRFGIDSLEKEYQVKLKEMGTFVKANYHYNDTVISSIPDSVQSKILVQISSKDTNNLLIVKEALQLSRNSKSIVEFKYDDMKTYKEAEVRHKVEWHRKFTFSVSCFLLFLVGAPLGAIVRKGGFGMPVVIAICFFILYYIMNIVGEKTSKEMVLPPEIGMWIPVYVLLPIGIWLIIKSSKDKSITDFTVTKRFIKNLFKRKNREED